MSLLSRMLTVFGLAAVTVALTGTPVWASLGNLSAVQEVPEPATLALLGTGAAIWFALRKVLSGR